MGLAWGVGFRLCERRLPPQINHKKFLFWFSGLFLSSWLGAKILFLLTQEQWESTVLLSAEKFWLGGGFVFLGGLFGGLAYTFLWGLFVATMTVQRMNFCLIPLLWAHAVGRLGCFLAGCCFGTISSQPWSVHLHGSPRHPVQLYEALGLALLAWWLQWRETRQSSVLPFYLLGYGILRWSVEWFRGDDIRGVWLGLSSSQWISGLMIFSGIVMISVTYLRRPVHSDN